MNILFLTTAHNSLSQRAFAELTDLGHEVHVQIASSSEVMERAVRLHKPDLIVAPFLKKYIPESIWMKYTCIIVHPGIKGDRGPSSLDWAILKGEEEWGVTLLQADAQLDAGDIWTSHNFKMRVGSKSSLYRREVTEAAIEGLLETVENYERGDFAPEKLDYSNARGRAHNPIKQRDRSIDWFQSTEIIAKQIRSADSQPGVLDEIQGESFYLYGVHEEELLRGTPGEIVGKRDGAICRATGTGAIWITHLKKKGEDKSSYFKLPATTALGGKLDEVSEVPIKESFSGRTFKEIWYEEDGDVGFLYFDFYNGTMSTSQCLRLKEAFIRAKNKNTKAIVLMGGEDFWSNGIHLNLIEEAESPADESWRNINAINDLIKEILATTDRLIVSVIRGNAAAGGVILALAADIVLARKGAVLNPHYKKMGLHGSEYWTYLLPRRVGSKKALEITEECLPITTAKAEKIGLIDGILSNDSLIDDLRKDLSLILDPDSYGKLLKDKVKKRAADKNIKPLEEYRKEELTKMWNNFYGPSDKYHIERRRFVYKA